MEIPSRAVSTILSSIAVFIGTVYLTFPTYSYEMLAAGIGYWVTAFVSLVNLLLDSGGVIALFVTLLYAFLTAVLFHVVYARLNGSSSPKNAVAVVPGVLVAGCASCGAGLLGLFAGVGVVSSFPFAGNGIRIFAVVVLLLALAYEGHPTTTVCRIQN